MSHVHKGIKNHCEHCDDTGVIYKVTMTRGGRTGYHRLPCPYCCQVGLNSGSLYTDEKYEQISIFKEEK